MGADPHELLELARVLAEPRARPRGGGGLAVLTCSGGDSGIAADEAELVGAELPALSVGTRERLTELLPDAATIGNPLDYTAMIWGDTDLLRRITVTVGDDPAIDQLLVLYDHPQGLAPEAAASWAAVRAGIVAGAAETKAATLVASTLPDLIDDRPAASSPNTACRRSPGLRTALACAQALRAQPGSPERLREIAIAATAAEGADDPGGDPRRLDRRGRREGHPSGGRAGGPRGQGRRRRGGVPPRRRRTGGPRGPEARQSRAAPQERRRRAAARSANGADQARAAYRELSASPAADGARVLVERMAPPGVELLVAARADAVVPALIVGLGGHLDRGARRRRDRPSARRRRAR